MQFHSAAKIAGSNPVEWMENADRWIVGFLEKFEEGCHMMVINPRVTYPQFVSTLVPCDHELCSVCSFDRKLRLKIEFRRGSRGKPSRSPTFLNRTQIHEDVLYSCSKCVEQ